MPIASLDTSVQTLDVISVNFWSILVSLLNLLIIFLIVKKFLFKPVNKVLDERKNAVDKIYSDANTAKTEAETNKKVYEDKLAGVREEAGEIIRAANDRAAAMSAEIISDANEKASATLKKADEDIAFEKKKAVNDIKNEISDISVSIAEKMLNREINDEDHKELIDSFIDQIGK